MATVQRSTLKSVIMAKYFKLFAVFLPLTSYLLLLTSCQEGGEAGDLFGQWRQDGSDTNYISFSGSVVWVRDLNHGEAYGTFQHQGDSLFMQCHSKKGLQGDTIAVEQSIGFKPIDNIRVKITTLDSDHLVLTKDGQTWRFYKY